MKEKYKLFSEQYNGLLDLVEKVDEDLARTYERVVENLPDAVKSKLIEKREFICDGKYYRSILDRYDDQLCFEYTRYDKYLCTSISLQPFYEEEISDFEQGDQLMDIDKDGLFLFSLSFINTEDEPTIKLNYEEIDNKPVFIGAKLNGIEINTEVFLKRKDDTFFLVSRQTFNDEGLIVYEKQEPVAYSELMSCIVDEDLDSYTDNYF